MATSLEKVKICSAHAIVMTKERDAVTTKYCELLSSVEQCVGFANQGMARLEAKVIIVTQKRDTCEAKAE